MAMAELPGPYDFRATTAVRAACSPTPAPWRLIAASRARSSPSRVERLMDKAARAVGIEPTEIRRRNLIAKFPYKSAAGLTFDEASYKETLEMALAAIDLPTFRRRQAKARAQGRALGIGFATFSERTGYGSAAFAARGMEITPGWETVTLAVDPSGFVEARIGSSPHGQGLRTTLAQIIADQIGIAPDRIKIVHGDTDRTPYGWGTFASRSLVICGGATLIAAQKVRAKLIKIASHMLEAAPGDIVLENGAATVDRHRPQRHDRQARARGLYADASLQRRDRAGPDRERHLRSARHVFEWVSRRRSRGRRRDRPDDAPPLSRCGRRRPHHQSDDCGWASARRCSTRCW